MSRLFVMFLAASLSLGAQEHKPTLSGCHALTGVTVLTSPGVRLEGATIVLRDGIIEAVGTDVAPPADAEIIDGAGFTVCAGFTLVGPGVGAAPPAPERTQPKDVTSAPADRATMGITPQRDVALALEKAEALSGKSWLAQGVTTVIVHPKGRLVPGKAAAGSTADGAARARLVKEDVALVIGFRGGRGGYPSSLMGIVAAHRQTFLDADRLRTWRDRFKTRPAGIPAPPFEPELDAVVPVLRGQLPALFQLGRDGDVRRALRIAEEFGLDAWLQGGAPLGKDVARIARARAVAIVDVPVPDVKYEANKDWLKAGKTSGDGQPQASAPGKGDGVSPAAAREGGEGEKPKPTVAEEDPFIVARRHELAAREREKLEPLVHAGGAAAVAGAPLVFGAIKPAKLLDHLRTQVRFGLDPGACLQALTLRPASLLGLDRSLGKVATGFRADLVVFKGAPFEDGRVAHVFCRGERYDLPEKKKDKAEEGEGGDPAELEKLAGTWVLEMEGRDDPGALKLELADGALSGALDMGRGEIAIDSASVDGRDVKLNGSIDREEFTADIVVTAKLSEDAKSMEGTIKFGEFGERPFKATKKGDGR